LPHTILPSLLVSRFLLPLRNAVLILARGSPQVHFLLAFVVPAPSVDDGPPARCLPHVQRRFLSFVSVPFSYLSPRLGRGQSYPELRSVYSLPYLPPDLFVFSFFVPVATFSKPINPRPLFPVLFFPSVSLRAPSRRPFVRGPWPGFRFSISLSL